MELREAKVWINFNGCGLRSLGFRVPTASVSQPHPSLNSQNVWISAVLGTTNQTMLKVVNGVRQIFNSAPRQPSC